MKEEESSCSFADERQGDGGMSPGGTEREKGQDRSRGKELGAQTWDRTTRAPPENPLAHLTRFSKLGYLTLNVLWK